MAKFDVALKYMLRFEGGFFHSKFDAGAKTRYGITQYVAKENGYVGDMEKFPKSMAVEIYRKRYWVPLCLNTINQNIANIVFDMGVNAGIIQGGICFQNALNLINIVLKSSNNLEKLYESLTIDGKIGTNTLNAYVIIYNRSELQLLFKWINYFKADYYKECALNEARIENGILTQKGFIRSWSRRIS